jgi:hypothetical protein
MYKRETQQKRRGQTKSTHIHNHYPTMFNNTIRTIYILIIHLVGFMMLLKWHKSHLSPIVIKEEECIKEEEEEVEIEFSLVDEPQPGDTDFDPNGMEPADHCWRHALIHLREYGNLSETEDLVTKALFMALGCPQDVLSYNAQQVTDESREVIRYLVPQTKIYIGFREHKITEAVILESQRCYRELLRDRSRERVVQWRHGMHGGEFIV